MTRCRRLEIGVSWPLMAMVTRDGDGVMVGAVTAERLPPGLPLEDLGDLALRNVEAPVRAFRLAAEDAVPAARVG